MQFNDKTFCPHIIDKSTPISKYLYCTKIQDLCKMITFFPNGNMTAKSNVKEVGCPYGYVTQDIQDIGKEVKRKQDILGDISIAKTERKVKAKTENKVVKENVTPKEEKPIVEETANIIQNTERKTTKKGKGKSRNTKKKK